MNAMNVMRVVVTLISAALLEAQAAGFPAATGTESTRLSVTLPNLPSAERAIPLTREFPQLPKSTSAKANGAGERVFSQERLSLNSAISVAAEDLVLPVQDSLLSLRTAPVRAQATPYTRGYEIRAKIHRYASYATVPVFVAEAAIGQKLFDNSNSSESLRSAHSALATGTAVLFGVNSVTGVWNMLATRKNPSGRGKRLFHGILMLGADAGFVATGALAPDREEGRGFSNDDASAHRAVALVSMGVATASYLYMLFAR